MAVNETELAAASTKYASFWRRLAAFIIDTVVLILAILLVQTIVLVVSLPETVGGGHAPTKEIAIVEVLSRLIAIGYFIFMHGKYGATLGKMAVKIRIVALDEQPIDYACAALRYSPFIVLAAIAIIVPMTGFPIQAAKGLGALYALIGALILAFHPQKRTIHDFIAGTVVINRRS